MGISIRALTHTLGNKNVNNTNKGETDSIWNWGREKTKDFLGENSENKIHSSSSMLVLTSRLYERSLGGNVHL